MICSIFKTVFSSNALPSFLVKALTSETAILSDHSFGLAKLQFSPHHRKKAVVNALHNSL